MKRVLAHKIVYQGKEYTMSVAQISDDCRSCTVSPFADETPATIFVNGVVRIVADDDGLLRIVPES